MACESISRQIRGWANSLQNSAIEGQRHLNDQSRARYDSQKRRLASDEEHRRWHTDFEERLRSSAIKQHEQTGTPIPAEESNVQEHET